MEYVQSDDLCATDGTHSVKWVLFTVQTDTYMSGVRIDSYQSAASQLETAS